MGREQPPNFYDRRLAEMSAPLESIHWAPLYQAVADLLPSPEDAGPIADLGCGTGRFAELLRRRGYTSYWGVDFSRVRVGEARSYVPGFTFDVGDVFDPEISGRFSSYTTFVITEVLEHVERDLELLESVPKGANVVLSVPSYDSAGHTRFFRSMQAVRSRYGDVLDLTPGNQVALAMGGRRPAFLGGRRIFVASGSRA